jgi:LuxR family maltose regulon positive regulatory protein
LFAEDEMALPLLKTKFYIPPVRPGLVSRPRLVERLDEGLRLGRKLTLISAPAGFGKTTLLSEWIASCTQETRVAWLSLDKGDANSDSPDLPRFLAYLVGAVHSVHPEVGGEVVAALQSPQPPDTETILTSLINELAERPGPGRQRASTVLVLDDYQEVTAQPVHDALAYLLDHLPLQMHVMIATRVDPPWPLGRLRARQEVTELRVGDLRFTPEETARFLNDAMGLGLSAASITALDRRTEGWIAGLQMAALSIRGRDAARTEAFVQAFGGSHRFILDYLLEEVLGRQPPVTREFLLQTSILERISAPLCDAVTGRIDSRMMIEGLERANLFVVPLDDDRRWYRYHPLFADLLRSRLGQTQPDLVSTLHQRASEWHEQAGLLAEAVSHALRAGDAQRVAYLVAQNALTLIYHRELLDLAHSLSRVLQAATGPQPWLQVAYAWAMSYAGQLGSVEPALQAAQASLDGMQDVDEARHVEGHIAAIRAYAANLQGEQPRSIALARQALTYLPADALALRGFALSMLATVLRDGGNLAAAVQASSEAVTISRGTGDERILVTALCERATVQLWQGRYRDAAETCHEALALADAFAARTGQQLPLTALIYARLSSIVHEWNDLEEALHYAREAARLCELWGQADILVIAYGSLSNVLAARGDLDGALDMQQKARQVAGEISPWYGALQAGREALLRWTQGDRSTADRWVEESGLHYDDAFQLDGEGQYDILARILVAQGKLDRAWSLLGHLRATAEAAGATRHVVRALILQALALQAQGQLDRAVATLERAVILAEPEGFVRTFTGAGPPIAALLRKVAGKGVATSYVNRLLAEPESEATAMPSTAIPSPATLIAPLSERELEVLRLLRTPLSQREIGDRLTVSVNTIRTHVKHIYEKLDVHSRLGAVERAEELGLL